MRRKEGEHVHTRKYSRKPLVLAICLLVTLALTGVAAWADEWGSGPKTVTVSAIDDFKDDIATIPEEKNIVVDVITIGSATRNSQYITYDYALIEPFASDEELASSFANGDWATVAEKAVEVVKNSSVASAVVGKLDTQIYLNTTESEGDGVYLVLPHGADQEQTSLKAYSAVYEYVFNPSIVALPTKDGVEEGSTLNSAYGAWVPDARIVFKADRNPRFGALRITKNVTDFSGEPATFVFHVVSEATDTAAEGELYDNYASVYYDGTDANFTELKHVPAEVRVKVTEVYTGGRYEATSDDQYTTIVASDTVEVTFTNRSNGSGKPGHGIENHFVYKMDEGGGAWSEWTPTPSDEAHDQAKE